MSEPIPLVLPPHFEAGVGAEAKEIALYALEQVAGPREPLVTDAHRALDFLEERRDALWKVLTFGVRSGPSDRWREAADTDGDLATYVEEACAYLRYALEVTADPKSRPVTGEDD